MLEAQLQPAIKLKNTDQHFLKNHLGPIFDSSYVPHLCNISSVHRTRMCEGEQLWSSYANNGAVKFRFHLLLPPPSGKQGQCHLYQVFFFSVPKYFDIKTQTNLNPARPRSIVTSWCTFTATNTTHFRTKKQRNERTATTAPSIAQPPFFDQPAQHVHPFGQ